MKRPICPKCKSEKVVKIVYGYIVNMEECKKEIEDGIITLGGCCTSDDSPKWHCNSCNHEFGTRFHTLEELNQK